MKRAFSGSRSSVRIAATNASICIGTQNPPRLCSRTHRWSGMSLATQGIPRARYSPTLVGDETSKRAPRGMGDRPIEALATQRRASLCAIQPVRWTCLARSRWINSWRIQCRSSSLSPSPTISNNTSGNSTLSFWTSSRRKPVDRDRPIVPRCAITRRLERIGSEEGIGAGRKRSRSIPIGTTVIFSGLRPVRTRPSRIAWLWTKRWSACRNTQDSARWASQARACAAAFLSLPSSIRSSRARTSCP